MVVVDALLAQQRAMPKSALRVRLNENAWSCTKPPTLWRIMRRGVDMKEATKRADSKRGGSLKRDASEALAQMLAVTAMLVIAVVIFYWR